jgi:hypothetical protein
MTSTINSISPEARQNILSLADQNLIGIIKLRMQAIFSEENGQRRSIYRSGK